MGRSAIIAEFSCHECGKKLRACATESAGWMLTCPDGHAFCVNPNGVQRTTSGRGNRVFVGQEQESMSFGFAEHEVKEVRQLLGEAGNCVQNDGTVRFTDRAEERKFRETYVRTRDANERRVDEARERAGLGPLER